jgi:serine/threonine protein kinase/tetratricopeptide (TPR) repeat protein
MLCLYEPTPPTSRGHFLEHLPDMADKSQKPQLKPGDVVAGRFRIVEEIGSGGFSVVYRAHQESMNRFVALKVLKPTASSDEKLVERFRREALFASHLSHPNTITLFDYGHTDEGLCFIAMEYLVGRDLAAVVERGEPVALERVWHILVQCCRSLAEAHDLGLVHRDLKPENIFLVDREDGEAIKVLDFGVSKAVSNFADAGPRTMAPLTQEGTVFGTPLYMAPEQAMAESIAPSVDVYALGHIAYEMITGRAAYIDCTSAMDVMLKQINDPPLELPEPWDQTPFSPLITRCTLKEPEERVQDASELLDHLFHDAFASYMSAAERASRTRSMPRVGLEEAPDVETIPGDDQEAEERYGAELSVLEEALGEVRDEQQMRLVIIRGAPGSGRRSLLRAFLARHRDQTDVAIAHRQSHADQQTHDAGLEADLACLTDAGLEGSGVGELRRMLHRHYAPGGPRSPEEAPPDAESAPISVLGAERDKFLTRISGPFRDAAERGALIWGLEDLEKVDTLTLAFLDRFFDELGRKPAPVLIVTTVHTDDLMRRPGLLRYTQKLLQASRPIARQISLTSQAVAEAGEAEVPEPPAGLARDSSEPITASPDRDALAEETDPTELFDEPADVPVAERSEVDVAFDTVLGFLAELGDEVPEDLWKLARARVLPTEVIHFTDFIVEQAERFGIIQRRDQALSFSQPTYAERMRQGLDALTDPLQTHLELAALMLDYFDTPNREQLQTVVRHLRTAQAPFEAIQLLLEAGERAYHSFDLDSAREYYMQVRQMLDDLDSGRIVVGADAEAEAGFERARIWVRLGEIHGAMGEHGAAEDAVQKAAAPESDAGPELRGRAFKILGDLAVSQERFAQAKAHYRDARDCFREASHPGAFVAAMGAMGHCALMEGKPEEAAEILDVALQRAERLKNEVLGARLGRFMGQVLMRQASFEDAVEHLESSLSVFESIESRKELAETLVEVADARFATVDYAGACRALERARSTAESHHINLGDAPHLGLGRAHAALGELDEAAQSLAEALGQATSRGDRLQQARVHLHIGDLLLARRQLGEALEHFQQVGEIASRIGHTELRLDASIRRAYLSFDAGDSGAAYEQLGQTMQLAESTGDAAGELQVRAHVIYLQLLEHDFRTRGATFASLIDQSSELGASRARILCQLFKADVHTAHGEHKVATQLLDKARLGAAELRDYALLVPLTRRIRLLAGAAVESPDGFGLGGLVAPEVGRRRFDVGRLG